MGIVIGWFTKEVQPEDRADAWGRITTAVIAIAGAGFALLATDWNDDVAQAIATIAVMIAVCRALPTGLWRVGINGLVAAFLIVLAIKGQLTAIGSPALFAFGSTICGIVGGDLLRLGLQRRQGAKSLWPCVAAASD